MLKLRQAARMLQDTHVAVGAFEEGNIGFLKSFRKS